MPRTLRSRKKTSDLRTKIILVSLSIVTFAVVLFSYVVYSTKLSYHSKAAPMDSPDEIVTGYPASYEDWPFLVELVDRSKIDMGNPKSVITNRLEAHICGGSLISSEWVITARHCINPPDVDEKNIVIVYYRNNFSDPSIELVSEIIKFEDSNSSAENDLALIKLKNKLINMKTVPLTDKFEYPTLDNKDTHIPTDVTIAGWGTTEKRRYKLPSEPQETILTTVPPVFDNNIYAQDLINKSGACGGDSGGPLIIYQKGKRVLVGITSGIFDGCGELNHFVNLTKYITSWITKKTNDSVKAFMGSYVGNPIPKPVFRRPTIVKDRWWLPEK